MGNSARKLVSKHQASGNISKRPVGGTEGERGLAPTAVCFPSKMTEDAPHAPLRGVSPTLDGDMPSFSAAQDHEGRLPRQAAPPAYRHTRILFTPESFRKDHLFAPEEKLRSFPETHVELLLHTAFSVCMGLLLLCP